MINELVNEFAKLKEVQAITLGGSRATDNYDQHSDYDVYVYLKEKIQESTRKSILEKYCSYMEYSNHFWELEDDGVLLNNIQIEFIYRDLKFIPAVLNDLFINGNTGNGYTTCFYDNLIDCKILYEQDNYITNLKEEFKDSYTDEIARLIINNNKPLLIDSIPALYGQIEKATKRDDLVAVNHRVSEFFAIYFDILFALNKEPHPGEKRLLEYSLKLSIKPLNMAKNINDIFKHQFANYSKLLSTLKVLISELLELLEEYNY